MEHVKDKDYCIVYNLYQIEGLQIFFPSATICESEAGGKLGYMRAAALVENVESYGISFKGTVHENLLDLCKEMTIPALEQVYNKNQKKPRSFTALFNDAGLQKTVQAAIDRRMSKFFETVREHNLPICLDIQRKIKAEDVRLFFFGESAIPNLHFTKMQTGIRYDLTLQIGEDVIRPNVYDIKLLTNFPGIILTKRQILWLEQINSAKLKPFLKAESVLIPEKHVRTYFDQFIIDIMGKVDIQVDGFDLIKLTDITKATIRLVHDIFADRWVMDVGFEYGNFSFQYSEKNRRKTKLSFSESDHISVYQCVRDIEEEETFIKKILDLGFVKSESGRFGLGEGSYDVLHAVGKYLTVIEETFVVDRPEWNDSVISLSTMQIHHNFIVGNDWFDLKGIIVIRGEEYPFYKFLKNIKDKNVFFQLRDGSVFVLPEEMMAQYEQMAKFAIQVRDNWKLAKQHFTLLEQMGMSDLALKNTIVSDEDIIYTPSSKLKASLRPYQIEGVKWLIKHRKNNMGACLADDMGLGKTLQTLGALLDAKEQEESTNVSNRVVQQLDLFGEVHLNTRKPLAALIILPASLVFNWYNEIRTFVPSFHVINYTGSGRKKAERTLTTFDIIITTYQTAVLDLEILKKNMWTYIILDESQQIRNKNSKVFQALNQLQTRYKISLSGTPIENSLSDLWSQMEFINPDILGTHSFFKNNFQSPIEKNKDEQAIIELKTLVDPFILRRTKEQVAPDLPKLFEKIHYSEMSAEQAKLYEKEKSSTRNFLAGLDVASGQYKIHVLASLTRLRQISNHPLLLDKEFKGDSGKFEDVTSQLHTIIKSKHKVLVFSSFKTHLNIVAEWLKSQNFGHVTLTGDTKIEERAKMVNEFQSNAETQVFLISIKAGGTGLNLTKADYVFILDPWWNPFVEMQAIARAHRIGRENPVIVTRFISNGTLEEKILRLQERKRILSDDIIDVDRQPNLSKEDLDVLLE